MVVRILERESGTAGRAGLYTIIIIHHKHQGCQWRKGRVGWEYKYRLATDMLGMITSRCEGSGKKPSQSVRQCCWAYLVKVILLESWILWGELSRKLWDEYWNNKDSSVKLDNKPTPTFLSFPLALSLSLKNSLSLLSCEKLVDFLLFRSDLLTTNRPGDPQDTGAGLPDTGEYPQY